MVTNGKKSGSYHKTTMAGRKVPFLDLYLVKGADIRKWQESKIVRAKMMAGFLSRNLSLKKRLARYEG